MNKKVWKKIRTSLINMDIVDKMTPEGFTNGKKFLFARLIFNNSYAMKKFRYLFEQSKIYIPGVLKKSYQFKTYEANLPPMLRCFHIMKVKGCGWVSVNKYSELFDLLREMSDIVSLVRVGSFNMVAVLIDNWVPMHVGFEEPSWFSADRRLKYKNLVLSHLASFNV